MPKLNQIIAVSKTKKAAAKSTLTNAYQAFQKSDLFKGLTRTYQPRDDDGDRYPDESKRVINKVDEIIASLFKDWTDMVNVVTTQDTGNTIAKADISVDGQQLAADVPVTTLIFLEKQLEDIKTAIKAMPILEQTEEWNHSSDVNLYLSAPVKTIKTKKVEKPIVLYDATPEHFSNEVIKCSS